MTTGTDLENVTGSMAIFRLKTLSNSRTSPSALIALTTSKFICKTFIPVKIYAGTDKTFPDEKLRTPFVGEPLCLGKGSYSVVYKENIAVGQYFDLDKRPNGNVSRSHFLPNLQRYLNIMCQAQAIVRKSFRMTTTQFQKELEDERMILNKLRSGLFENSRIMQSLGSVTRGLSMDILSIGPIGPLMNSCMTGRMQISSRNPRPQLA